MNSRVFASCRPKPTGSTVWLVAAILFCSFLPSVVSAQESIVLRISSWAGAEELLLEEEIARAFMRENPDIEVIYEPVPGNYKEKILSSIAAGTAPDIFLLDSTIIPALVNRGVLVDLSTAADTLGVDLKGYFPNVLSTFQSREKLYAFPKGYTPVVMYYNRTLFRASDVPFPKPDWTWDDFLEIAQKLTLDTDGNGQVDQYGTVFLNRLFLWQPWIWMNGGDILSEDGSSTTGYLDASSVIEALQFQIDLVNRYRVTPQSVQRSDFSTANGMFYSNRIGMMPSGHWALIGMAQHIGSGAIDVGVAPLPTPGGGQPSTVIYASGWCVPVRTKYPAQAAKLAAFLGGEEAARIRARSGLEISAVRTVAEAVVRQDSLGIEQTFLDVTAYGRQPWGTKIEEFSRLETLAEEAVEISLMGRAGLTSSLSDAAKAADIHLIRASAVEGEAADLEGNPEVLYFLLITSLLIILCISAAFWYLKSPDRIPFLRGIGFLGPSLLILLVFVFAPVLFSFYLSFHQWNVVSSVKPFVGFDNYVQLLGDKLFWNALWNTFLYSLHVPVGMALSLAVALMMNQKIRGIGLLRTLYFLPSVSSFVAIALVWKWLYHPEFGLFNYILGLIGLPQPMWLGDPDLALPAVMLLSIWMGIGYQMVIFLAGLQSIPGELYESARIDGAGAWRRFTLITLPLLRPTTFFVLVTSVIASFQVFALVYVMTEGGPVRSTDVVVYHIYENAWDYLQMGYASAMSWMLFLIIVAGTWLQFRFLGKEVSYT